MTPLDRFYQRFIVNPDTGCWEWTGRKSVDGYACISEGHREWRAHRFIFVHKYGFDPETVDHACRVRHCVNPDHLRPATRKQQAQYRRGPNQTGYKGVARVTGSLKFQARIKVDGDSLYLGVFDTAEEAALAYQLAAQEHFGEFAHA